MGDETRVRSAAMGAPARQGRRDGPGGWRAWCLFFFVFLALFFMNASLSVVMTVLPDIAHEFHSTVSAAIWVTIATNLLTTGLLPASGKLGDVLGHREVWVFGMALRLGCLLLSSMAPSLSVLVFSRALSGVGGALDEPSGTAMVLRSFKHEQRPFFLGLSTAVGAAAQPLGLLIGGVVAKYFGWRWLFLAPFFVLCVLFVGAIGLLYGPYSPLKAEQKSGFLPLPQDEVDAEDEELGIEIGEALTEREAELDALEDGEDGDSADLPRGDRELDNEDADQDADQSQDQGQDQGQDNENQEEAAEDGSSQKEDDLEDAKSLKHFDFLGTFLFTASVALFLLFLNLATSIGIKAGFTMVSGVLFPVASAGFIWVEKKARFPVIPLVLFQNTAVFTTLLAYSALWMPYLGVWLLLPLYLKNVKGLDEVSVASLICIRPFSNALANMVGGFLIRRKALSIFSSINSGAVLMTVAYVLLNVFVDLTSSEDASASSGRGLAVLQVCLVIMGLGVGLTFNATSSFVMDVAPENLLANVFGVIRMAQQVFILLGYIVAEAIIGDKPSEESNPGRYVTTARVMLAMNALYCMYPAWSCGFVQGRKEEATKSRKIDAAQTATTPGR